MPNLLSFEQEQNMTQEEIDKYYNTPDHEPHHNNKIDNTAHYLSSDNNDNPYESLANAFTNTGNFVTGAGGIISYVDPYTGALISAGGAGLSGIGSVINYLTSP